MDTPTPLTTPATPTGPIMPPIQKNNNKTVIIVVIAIIILAIGYMGYQRWQERRAVNALLGGLGLDEKTAQQFAKDMSEMAQNLNIPEDAQPATPAEIYAAAEEFDVSNAAHKELVQEIGGIVKTIFGDYKVSGYTPGYMGMNSGSGVTQFTVTKPLVVDDIGALAKELEAKGFTTTASPLQGDSASIVAQKGDYTYTIGYNKGEQQIVAIIIFNGDTTTSNE
jgi:hypothetical protein